MGKKAEKRRRRKKNKRKEKKFPLSEPVSPLLFKEEALPHVTTSFSLFCLCSFIPSTFLHVFLPFFPPFFLFLSCCCSCFSNLFLKVHIKIPALIPEKQLCFPRHWIAQLVVWLRATTSYAASFYVAKEHLVQCHFLSKPNSITMHTGPRSHRPHKISLW